MLVENQITVWKNLKIINCFTCEASFCGPKDPRMQYSHRSLEVFRVIDFFHFDHDSAALKAKADTPL
jgi:hypothetical protein